MTMMVMTRMKFVLEGQGSAFGCGGGGGVSSPRQTNEAQLCNVFPFFDCHRSILCHSLVLPL